MLISSVTCCRHLPFLFIYLFIYLFCNQGNVKWFQKSMKIVNIEGENLHVFGTIWGISMKFSGKMWLMTKVKVTKKQGFTISLENTVLEIQPGGGGRSRDQFLNLLRVSQCSIFISPEKIIKPWCFQGA